MAKNQENYFIDFLRFIFSLCILVYHSWIFTGVYGNGILNNGCLAVDFYFIVTGYLMINSMYKREKNKLPVLKDSFDFVYKKIKGLFPALLVTFLIGMVFVYGKHVFWDFNLLLSNRLLPELFQLGIFGYELSINSSWWYISAMFFVLALLYPLAAKYKEDYCKYIAPIILIITLGIVKMYQINIDDPLSISFFLRNGLYKAIIFIILGNIAYVIANIIKEKNIHKNAVILLSIIEPIMYIIILLNLHYAFMNDFVHAIILTISIALTFSNVTMAPKIFKHNIWKKIGLYGVYIYLCHISIRTYMLRKCAGLDLTYKQMLIQFFIISCLVALFIYIIVEIVYKKLILQKKYKQIIMKLKKA